MLKVFLNSSPKLNSSQIINSSYNLELINENDLIFKIKASKFNFKYICQFTITDYLNMQQKDFIKNVNNFKLLLKAFDDAFYKKKITLCKLYDCLLLTIYYTVIFEEKKIYFELHKQLPDEENKNLIGINNNQPKYNFDINDYKAEIIESNSQFEDYGDRYKLKLIFKNKGKNFWPKKKNLFKMCY